MLENDNSMHSTSIPGNFPVERSLVTSEEFCRYVNESWGLRQRHMRDARINSASLSILERQAERVNENLNAVFVAQSLGTFRARQSSCAQHRPYA